MLLCADFFIQYNLICAIACLKEIIVKGEEAAQVPAVTLHIASSSLRNILSYKIFSIQEALKVIQIIQSTPYKNMTLQITEDDSAQPTLSLD